MVNTDEPICRLQSLGQKDLDTLYRQSLQRDIPNGIAEGYGFLLAGTILSGPLNLLLRLFWQGKVFDEAKGELVNLVTFFRIRNVRAKVYVGESWFDHKESVIIDYAKTSLIAKFVRDEIRQIGPGLYLGQAYLGGKWIFTFALEQKTPPNHAKGGVDIEL